jgi:hypothetical protein
MLQVCILCQKEGTTVAYPFGSPAGTADLIEGAREGGGGWERDSTRSATAVAPFSRMITVLTSASKAASGESRARVICRKYNHLTDGPHSLCALLNFVFAVAADDGGLDLGTSMGIVRQTEHLSTRESEASSYSVRDSLSGRFNVGADSPVDDLVMSAAEDDEEDHDESSRLAESAGALKPKGGGSSQWPPIRLQRRLPMTSDMNAHSQHLADKLTSGKSRCADCLLRLI